MRNVEFESKITVKRRRTFKNSLLNTNNLSESKKGNYYGNQTGVRTFCRIEKCFKI